MVLAGLRESREIAHFDKPRRKSDQPVFKFTGRIKMYNRRRFVQVEGQTRATLNGRANLLFSILFVH
jgi:hypothetical protein